MTQKKQQPEQQSQPQKKKKLMTQDIALKRLKDKKGPVTFEMMSGKTYELDVRSYDQFTILGLENEDDAEYTLLFKHGIESVKVPRKKAKTEDS